MKLTFSAAKKTKNDTKRMGDSERTSKIKVRSSWTFFKILPMSAAWKRGCTISSKEKLPQSWLNPF